MNQVMRELEAAEYHPVFLSLGSNLGRRRLNLARALQKLRESSIEIRRVSSLYITEPVDMPEQPDFLNLACQLKTSLDGENLLAICLKIEKEMGRVRSIRRGPRLIDIDIIYIGSQVINTADLIVPHPRRLQRRFVLEPISEIAPDFPDPVTKSPVSTLLRHCPDRARVEKSGKLEEKIWK